MSTIEVANIMSGLQFIKDVNVYGVKVPGWCYCATTILVMHSLHHNLEIRII